MTKTPILIAAFLAASTGSLMAKPALKDVSHVSEGLIAVGIAYEISQVCDGLSARLLRGYNYLNSLKDHARDLGYTEAEIEAYIDNRAEQDRLEAVARARLASKGAEVGQADTYCAVGRTEIASGTAIGRLLR